MRRVLLTAPGPKQDWQVFIAMWRASFNKEVKVEVANLGFAVGNFDGLWCAALNAFEDGLYTHFAMIHSDVHPDHGWLDILLEEMDKFKVSLVSAAIPIKDYREVYSCGMADPSDPWKSYVKVTGRQLRNLPETFDSSDLGKPDWPLLHNNGLWLADLSDPMWRKTDRDGNLVASFQFPRKSWRDKDSGKWTTQGISEDWWFSQRMHELGIKSKVTKKIRLAHRGEAFFTNWEGQDGYVNGFKIDKNGPYKEDMMDKEPEEASNAPA